MAASFSSYAKGGNTVFFSDTIHLSENSILNYQQRVVGKIQRYEERIANKTEKTLTKLSRWENKIRAILKKADPGTEARLFGEGQQTFTSLLQQYKEGKEVAVGYQSQYNAYLDTLKTSLKYMKDVKENGVTNTALEKADKEIPELEQSMSQASFTKEFIKQRKDLLVKEAGKYLEKKLIAKISKENYYYGQALDNYQEILSDKTKVEALVKRSLNEIPAFKEFMRKNSMLASLFSIPGNDPGGTSTINLTGLQTRTSVQNMIQQRIAAGGPGAASQMRQNLSEAQSKLTELKDKLLKGGTLGSGGDVEMPAFKPNEQKSKTLWQRLEYGFDVQFAKSNGYLPSSTDIAITLGYKLNDRSVIGTGVSYKLGLGSIDYIRFSSEGVGVRSFLDWKIKGSIYASGGYEMNYNSSFKRIGELKQYDAWQRSALIGVSKKYKVGKKMKGEVKILYDFLAREHVPVRSPLVFRVGYKM